jgi:hypothetical protein
MLYPRVQSLSHAFIRQDCYVQCSKYSFYTAAQNIEDATFRKRLRNNAIYSKTKACQCQHATVYVARKLLNRKRCVLHAHKGSFFLSLTFSLSLSLSLTHFSSSSVNYSGFMGPNHGSCKVCCARNT